MMHFGTQLELKLTQLEDRDLLSTLDISASCPRS